MLPFAALLLTIAIAPVLLHESWRKQHAKICAGFAALTVFYYIFALGSGSRVGHASLEYASFIFVVGRSSLPPAAFTFKCGAAALVLSTWRFCSAALCSETCWAPSAPRWC
jgi:hypothetical protein